MNPTRHSSFSYDELLAMVRDYAAACRRHDKQLLMLFVLALLPASEAMLAASIWHDGRALGVFSGGGGFAQWWTLGSLIAAAGLALHIIWSSNRFYRDAVPKCPRCTSAIRDLDDVLMALSVPELGPRQPAKPVQCDACDHVIAFRGGDRFAADRAEAA